MRRILLSLLVVAGIVLALRPASAEAHTGRYVVSQSAGNGLNLRTGPGGQYRVVLTMQRGDVLKARGHRGNWMYLTHLGSGLTGWASMTYIAAAAAPTGTTGVARCFPNSWGQTVCAAPWIAETIAAAARRYGVGVYWLMATAACESDFNPWAFNGLTGVSGIFQFLPSTFYAFGGTELWSVWQQADVAARMFSRGLAFHWHCARRIGYA